MGRVSALLLAALPALSLADVDPRFARLRDAAEPLGGLGSFIEKYVGDCGALDGPECRRNAEAFRRKATGKKFYMIVTEDSVGISMGRYDASGEFTLNVVPFFGAAGSAVTHGAPSRTDANGNPILPFITVDGMATNGTDPSMIERWVRMRALRLQVVFTPQGLWTLKKKGGGTITGVKARIEAILVTVGRTGEQVGLWLRGD